MAVELVKWGGKTYRMDIGNPTVGQMSTMRMFTGLTYGRLLEAVDEVHDQALTALLWLMFMQNGEPCNIEETPWGTDGPVVFYKAFAAREPVEEADPNSNGAASPTPSSTLISGSFEPATSGPSPSNATFAPVT